MLARDEVQRIFESAFPEATSLPIIEEVTDSGVIVRYPIDSRHERPGGTVSGPTMMMLADTAAYAAILSRIGSVLLAVTTSLHIDFLRRPAMTDLLAEGTILKLGRQLAVVEVAICSDGSSEVVAKAQATYSLPRS